MIYVAPRAKGRYLNQFLLTNIGYHQYRLPVLWFCCTQKSFSRKLLIKIVQEPGRFNHVFWSKRFEYCFCSRIFCWFQKFISYKNLMVRFFTILNFTKQLFEILSNFWKISRFHKMLLFIWNINSWVKHLLFPNS